MPTLANTRFGAIEFIEEDVITFCEGLIGFPNCTRFVFVTQKPESPFRWLQSLDLPEFAFLVADPCEYVENYSPVLGDEIAAAMEIDDETPTFLFTTVSIPRGKPREMTLNLAGPIVINAATRIGRQFVVDNEAYTIKHRVFPDGEPEGQRAAA